ncbi:hypothetical protein RJ640_010091 [Escallonia rubra]|uniref:RNase H type-1 domain-containing protein n=1 Tax=Escallonia rubra TaxID=112253 RepID=A0AA88Q9C5_9ASTE|nr:hypothetical protein RJ640_010091 [Escallonia rubra]
MEKQKVKKFPKSNSEDLVSDELLVQTPRSPVTLKEFMPPELQALNVPFFSNKVNGYGKFSVECMVVVIISDDEREEEVAEGNAFNPIIVPDSPVYWWDTMHILATPPNSPQYFPTSLSTPTRHFPVVPSEYCGSPDFVKNRKFECKSNAEELWSTRKRLRFENSIDSRTKHCSNKEQIKSWHLLEMDKYWTTETPSLCYSSLENSCDEESVSKGQVRVDSNPSDDEKARIEARRERGDRASVTVSLKEEGKFYEPRPIEINMLEPLETDNMSVQSYDLMGRTIDEKIEMSLELRVMGSLRPRNLFPSWVEQTPFPEGYELQTLLSMKVMGIPNDMSCVLLSNVEKRPEIKPYAYVSSHCPWMELPLIGDITDEGDDNDDSSSDISVNMVSISDDPQDSPNREKSIVEVSMTYLTYKRRQQDHQQSSKTSTLTSQKEPSSEEQVKYDVLAHLKKVPALLRIYDALKMSPELRRSLIYALSNLEDFREEVDKRSGMGTRIAIMISFNDNDMHADEQEHNRPLFITGKTKCMHVDTYNKFLVPPKEKGLKPIWFHAMRDVERKLSKESPFVQGEESLPLKDAEYSAKTTRMLKNIGLDPEKVTDAMRFYLMIFKMRPKRLMSDHRTASAYPAGLMGWRSQAELGVEEFQPNETYLPLVLPLAFILARSVLGHPIGREYVAQKVVKGQALADFLAAHPIPDDSPLAIDLPDEEVMHIEVQKGWEMYFDRASRSHDGTKQETTKNNKSGFGIVFVTPEGALLPYSFALSEGCSNNEAEYESVITGLELALQIPIVELTIYGDSQLVVKQLRGEYMVRRTNLVPYHERANQLLSQFGKVQIFHVRRGVNARVDPLAGLATSMTLPDNKTITITVGERRVLQPLNQVPKLEPIFYH